MSALKCLQMEAGWSDAELIELIDEWLEDTGEDDLLGFLEGVAHPDEPDEMDD